MWNCKIAIATFRTSVSSRRRNFMNEDVRAALIKGRFGACLHGGGETPGRRGNPVKWGYPVRWGYPQVHIFSHFNLITFTWLVGWPAKAGSPIYTHLSCSTYVMSHGDHDILMHMSSLSPDTGVTGRIQCMCGENKGMDCFLCPWRGGGGRGKLTILF